jgi:hypothetical protein
MMDPSSDKESAAARTALLELLKENGRTWHDLQKIMAGIEMQRMASEEAAAAATRAAGWKKGPDGDDLGIPGNDLLGLMVSLIAEYIWVTAEQLLTIALWILHTYTFHQFRHTPRLLIISPIEECGKTTVLKVIEQLVHEPERYGSVTAATIYHQLEHTPGITLLIDEADNLDLFNDRKMRQIFSCEHKIDAEESVQEKEVLYQLDPVEGMLAWCDAYLAGERATKVLKTCKVGSNWEIKGEISGHGIFAWKRIKNSVGEKKVSESDADPSRRIARCCINQFDRLILAPVSLTAILPVTVYCLGRITIKRPIAVPRPAPQESGNLLARVA